ncbi:MAG: Phytoene synthase [Acidobacteriaceae bacterium]|nr:Phytoene synthase [Acidobacteriaceae bacterium]
MNVAQAYLECREIARREAKNFYYSFRVLPQHKSDAMCAVYAFMRRADDIADDESLTIEARREVMAEWVGAWRAVQAGGASDDAVFVAVRDTQSRFNISDELLDQLVQGTTMDLEIPPEAVGTVQTYADFAELYRYCYLVASVVGLVCIKIFGYSDVRAEKLAEETGIAFQLTNILRDVKEDVERGRVYLPLDLLDEFGVSLERVNALASGATMEPHERAMLASLAAKAEGYYGSAAKLLPMIDRDSRAALWVLVRIYHDLLKRIGGVDHDVFSQRVSVPTPAKLMVLARGMAMAAVNRVIA